MAPHEDPPPDSIAALEQRLGYRFRRRGLLEVALTHRSYANERALEEDYERLEFLGDAVIGLIAADLLYRMHPERTEGELSKLKSYLVSQPVLARRAAALGLGEVLLLGVGEDRSGGRAKPSLLADTLEAVLGAVFLDGGLEGARLVGEALLRTTLEERERRRPLDPKTRLQEVAQARGWRLPDYRLATTEGPDHCKRFVVECWLDERRAGVGAGRTKKLAEQRAARVALDALELEEETDPGAPSPGG